jgi:hypothetical protein
MHFITTRQIGSVDPFGYRMGKPSLPRFGGIFHILTRRGQLRIHNMRLPTEYGEALIFVDTE